MNLPKRDGMNGRYYLIYKPDTNPEMLAEANLCIPQRDTQTEAGEKVFDHFNGLLQRRGAAGADDTGKNVNNRL